MQTFIACMTMTIPNKDTFSGMKDELMFGNRDEDRENMHSQKAEERDNRVI